MKSLVILIFLSFYSFTAFCQDDDTDNADSSGISGYISPFFQVSKLIKQSYFIGGTGAIFLDQNFFLGGFGTTMSNYFKTEKGKYSGNELDLGGGGIIMGYVFYHAKKIHPVLTLWGGGGSISVSDANKVRNKEAYDEFLIINGSLELEYRPLKFLSIGAGVQYQKVSGLLLDGYSEGDFSGPGVYFNIKAGLFQ